MRVLFVLCAMLGAVFALAAQTNSQPGASTQSPALVGTATNGPTTIQSDAGQFFLRSNVFVYRGDVRVDNPQMKLSCQLLTVEAPKMGTGKFNRATAETNVVIDWTDDKGPNHATADRAVYTYSLTNTAAAPDVRWETNAFVVLTGNPVFTNSQQTVHADPIVWDRINDVIYSTNFLRQEINPGETNMCGMFETRQPKTNAPAK